MKIRICIMAWLLWFPIGVNASLSAESGDLQAYLEGLPHGAQDDGRFRIPTADQQVTFGQVILLALQGNFELANAWAAAVGYELVAWSDSVTGLQYFVLRETNPIPSPLAHGGGTYVFRPSATYNVAIHAPHPSADSYTGLEAIEAFMAGDTRYFMLAGAHRRSHPEPGTCQDFSDYRPSDAVHNTAHYFYVAHRVMEDFDDSIHYVEFHGFGSDSLDVIASQCATAGNQAVANISETLPDTDPGAHTLMHSLEAVIGGAGEFTACIYSPVLDTGPADKYTQSLGGGTNTLARYTNDSPSVCDQSAQTQDNTHRYVHLEQSWDVRSSAENRGRMAGHVNQAIREYFDGKPLVMNAGLNDAWYNPVTNGQGFFVMVFPQLGKVSLSWFTYDTEQPPAGVAANLGDAGHRWMTALGPYEGNQAVLALKVASGGLFDTPFAEAEVTNVRDGTIVLTFDDCNSGTVEYEIPSIGRQGVIPIERVAGDNIVLCEALAD